MASGWTIPRVSPVTALDDLKDEMCNFLNEFYFYDILVLELRQEWECEKGSEFCPWEGHAFGKSRGISVKSRIVFPTPLKA